MLKANNMVTFGFSSAIRGMRNPYNSWAKSDSVGETIGEKDMWLCCKLIAGGSEHRKFLRMVHVAADVVAPLYWWKQADTYKVGTVENSTSTMHKIMDKPFDIDDFSTDGGYRKYMKAVVNMLNEMRDDYLKTKYTHTWRAVIQLLPSSYNQRRTVDWNYETLLSMYSQRKNHKLTEWKQFCDWIETLPYMKEFIKAMEDGRK